MKKFFLVLLFFIAAFQLSLFNSHASDLQALWTDAENSYRNGDYLRSAELFQKAAETDPSQWAAHYNAGNAFLKAEQIPDALEQYWKAFFANPRSAETVHNLKMALSRADDSLSPQGIPAGLYRFWHFLTPAEWTAFTLVFWWIFAFSLWALRYAPEWKKMPKKKLKKIVWTGGAACAVFLGMALSQHYAHAKSWGVLKGPGLLRAGPSDSLPVTVQIPEGRFIWILEERDGWVRIKTRKDGLEGWLR